MDWSLSRADLVVGAGVGALLIAVLYWTFSDRKWKRFAIILTICGSACIVSGPVGQWLGSITTTLDGWISGLVAQLTGAVVLTGLIGICLIVPLILHIKDNKIGTGTLVMGAVSPIAVALIPGYVGWALTTALSWVARIVTLAFAWGLDWQ